MNRGEWALRAGELFWSRTGWTVWREQAERFPSLEQARAARAWLDTDRDCVAVRLVSR